MNERWTNAMCFLRRVSYGLTITGSLLLNSCSSQDSSYVEELTFKTPQKSAKRGVAYGFDLPDVDMALLSPGSSWFYNWYPAVDEKVQKLTHLYGLEYLPMAWNSDFNADDIRLWKQCNPQGTYILAYNEPNLTDQCNETPQEAAKRWPELVALAQELNVKLVSPAMNYGTMDSYQDPIVWLDEFFEYVDLNSIDAIAVHCYRGHAGSLKEFIMRFKKYGKPIWLTEFCHWDHPQNAKDQMVYMSEALQYLESDPDVDRYAWFIPRTSSSQSYPYMQLLTNDKPYRLTDLGLLYNNFALMDQQFYGQVGQRLEAEYFTKSNVSDCIGTDHFVSCIHAQPTTDIDGVLEIYDLLPGRWVEYQIDLTQTKKHVVRLRYSCYYQSSLIIGCDGTDITEVSLPLTGDFDQWQTIDVPVSLPAGKHSLRIQTHTGGIALNWIQIN